MMDDSKVQEYIKSLAGSAAASEALGYREASDAYIKAALEAGKVFGVSADDFIIPELKAAMKNV